MNLRYCKIVLLLSISYSSFAQVPFPIPLPISNPDDIWVHQAPLLYEEFKAPNLNTSIWSPHFGWGCRYGPDNSYAAPENVVICDENVPNYLGDKNRARMFVKYAPAWYTLPSTCVNGGTQYLAGTASCISATNNNKHGYGLYEVRFKSSENFVLWPGIWLLGATQNDQGEPCAYDEINLFESTSRWNVVDCYHQSNGSDNCPAISYTQGYHWYEPYVNPCNDSIYENRTQGTRVTLPNGKKHSDDFHTYGLEYMEDYLIWYLDGEITHYEINPQTHRFPKHELRLIIDISINGWACKVDTFNGPPHDCDQFWNGTNTDCTICIENEVANECKPVYETNFCAAEIDFVRIYDIDKSDCQKDEIVTKSADLSNYISAVKQSLTFSGSKVSPVVIQTSDDWFFRAGTISLLSNVLIVNNPSLEGDVVLQFNKCTDVIMGCEPGF